MSLFIKQHKTVRRR